MTSPAKSAQSERPDPNRARDKLNAARKNISGNILIMPAEDVEAYNRICAGFHAEFKPQGMLETQYVQKLADTQWRLNQIPGREAALLALGHYDGKLKVDT